MSHRAELLAARIEAGAALLAGFAGGLTDAEWNTRVRDGRTVGVVVHHVASMYPIEMGVARAIASGQPVENVTWEDVNGINAKHALEHAGVGKAEALALLKRNSQEAAAEVRGFTDAQLDTAAPFSLSFGAPMTAQFVLEDHPLRHAWHHLARIKTALGREQLAAASA
ncbi:MAG: hypothetical protein H6Q77_1853 [Gemmatimonadetes bacterium]|nr:hypothetical protein [Gemmatimonadota bacterium]